MRGTCTLAAMALLATAAITGCGQSSSSDAAATPVAAAASRPPSVATPTSTPSERTPAAASPQTAKPTATGQRPKPTVTPTPRQTRPPRTSAITDDGKANGYAVALQPKDKVRITFDECTSCGYHWEVTAAPNARVGRAAGDTSESAKQPSGSSGHVVGGSGTHAFTFTAVGAGKTQVRLGYLPPGASTAERTVVLTITVR